MQQGTPRRWDSSNLPWHWSYLASLHAKCKAVLNDWTLRDPDNNPPPKSIWFNDKEIDMWRKDMERQRKETDT